MHERAHMEGLSSLLRDLNDWSRILFGLFRAVQPFAKLLLNMATRISGMQHLIRN